MLKLTLMNWNHTVKGSKFNDENIDNTPKQAYGFSVVHCAVDTQTRHVDQARDALKQSSVWGPISAQ